MQQTFKSTGIMPIVNESEKNAAKTFSLRERKLMIEK